MSEMRVIGIRVEQPQNQPVLLLREAAGERYLPIWIGQAEATAIVLEQEGVTPIRPLTHDLIKILITELGHTLDDAAGEAFDKVARLLGLQYPGGPSIERCAREGNPAAFDLPRALSVGPYDFSFSGLKTAVLRIVQDLQRAQGQEIPFRGTRLADASLEAGDLTLPVADLAASFQEALVGALVAKTLQALNDHHAVTLLVAGGVAANHRLRDELTRAVSVPVRYPPIRYCTDNAAMMGAAAYYRYLSGDRATLALDVLPGLALA